MKVSKKSLIVSIAVLCVCALSLSAASFAWFTNATQAKVDTLQMKVEQRSSLELSITGQESAVGWKHILGTADFKKANLYYDNNNTVMQLNDASTNDFSSWVKATYNDTTSKFAFTANADKASKTTAAADYLEMPIHFRAATPGSVVVNNPNFSLANTALAPALRVGSVVAGTKTIYGNPTSNKFTYQSDLTVTDNFTGTAAVTTSTKALSALNGLSIALVKNDTTGYYEATATFYVWIEGTDAACIDKNTPSDVFAAMDFNLVD